jgi:hypothetical protein
MSSPWNFCNRWDINSVSGSVAPVAASTPVLANATDVASLFDDYYGATALDSTSARILRSAVTGLIFYQVMSDQSKGTLKDDGDQPQPTSRGRLGWKLEADFSTVGLSLVLCRHATMSLYTRQQPQCRCKAQSETSLSRLEILEGLQELMCVWTAAVPSISDRNLLLVTSNTASWPILVITARQYPRNFSRC